MVLDLKSMTFIMPSEIIHKQRTDWDGVLEDLFGIGKCPDDQNRSIEKTIIIRLRAFIYKYN